MTGNTPVRMLDLSDIIRSSKKRGLLPIGKSALYELIRNGKFPRPLKIGRRSVWREADVAAAVERLTAEG